MEAKNKKIEKNKTLTPKQVKEPKKIIESKKWFIVDAKGKVIGRLATRVATTLLGKNKVEYLPYKDSGDFVIVINASKVASTGKKEEKKFYYHYSGYPGGLKERSLKTLRVEKPEEIIKRAVYGMLPKNRLGKAVFKKLFVYPGEKHIHEAQKAEILEI